MANTSATGGYLLPTDAPLPGGLTLNQFIQQFLVGISGISKELVRPRWQVKPLSQPPLETNWIGFGVTENIPDANAWTGQDDAGTQQLQRQETLKVQCAFYGPDAMNVASRVRDGLQITQNLEVLATGNMGFGYTDSALHIPDFVNERWVDRVEMAIFLRRQRTRIYEVLNIESAEGNIHTVVEEGEIAIPFVATEEI